MLKEGPFRKWLRERREKSVSSQLGIERAIFWGEIERKISDEAEDCESYRRLAKEAERLGFSFSFVKALLDISEDESKHRGILESFKARGGF